MQSKNERPIEGNEKTIDISLADGGVLTFVAGILVGYKEILLEHKEAKK
jgi:hypothetical protein